MTDFARDAILAKLRAQSRHQLTDLDFTVRAYIDSLPEAVQQDLSAWICEGRRLLARDDAPVAHGEPPKNVRRLFAIGKSGPAFEKSVFELAAGRAAVKCTRTTADEFAGAEDLPPGGPDLGGEA